MQRMSYVGSKSGQAHSSPATMSVNGREPKDCRMTEIEKKFKLLVVIFQEAGQTIADLLRALEKLFFGA